MSHKRLFILSPILLASVGMLAGCSSEEGEVKVIRILNSADYIYEGAEEGDEEAEPTPYDEYFKDEAMMDQFVNYMNEKHKDEGVTYSYVYDTFDTNETLYNELMTGKSTYDVINASDYMVQKLISYDLIQTLSFNKETYEMNDYTNEIRANISNFLWDKFDNIHPKNKDTDERMMDKNLGQYSVPYMWGTVGIMYNPAFQKFVDLGLSVDDVIDLFSSWDGLYSEEAKNTFSIKDSVRDTYVVSILHYFYESKIRPLEEKLENHEISEEEFNRQLNEIFNACDDQTLETVKEDMLALKANSFGFEVDSGKTDMVEGKIGANLAWSGDATWAITEAENDYGLELYFSIPEEGSNIWFDAWCVPNGGDLELALEFINFMSQPEQAIQNMDYVGYTSATAGDIMLDYVYWSYDVRGEVGEEIPDGLVLGDDYVQYDVSYFFKGSISDDANAVLMADTTYVGRQLTAQFPEQGELSHLCVMDDFGKQNTKVLDLWENVRTNPLPLWAVIVFIVELAIGLGLGGYFVVTKFVTKKLRKQRKENKQ